MTRARTQVSIVVGCALVAGVLWPGAVFGQENLGFPGEATACASTNSGDTHGPNDYLFVDDTGSMDVPPVPRISWGSAWADLDADGLPDLFVGRHYHQPLIYKNDCTQMTADHEFDEILTPGDRHNCAWGEANGDSRIDLFCTQGAERGTGARPKNLYIQQKDGTFVDEAAARGIDYPKARGRTINWIDYDSDGDLDIYFGAQTRDKTPSYMFKNVNGHFHPVGEGVKAIRPLETSAWLDWDHDDDPDLLVTVKDQPALAYRNVGGRYKSVQLGRFTQENWVSVTVADVNGDGWDDLIAVGKKKALVLKNDDGHFKLTQRIGALHARMATPLDVDNDGDLDFYLVRGARGNGSDPDEEDVQDRLLVNRHGQLEVVASGFHEAVSGNGDSASASDWDRDGAVDLFLSNGYKKRAGPFYLLDNRSAIGKWVGVYLYAGPRNPLGFGARVKVGRGKTAYWLSQSDGTVFRTQTEVGFIHAGIGNRSSVRIKVRWPAGDTDCVTISAGEMKRVSRGDSGC